MQVGLTTDPIKNKLNIAMNYLINGDMKDEN